MTTIDDSSSSDRAASLRSQGSGREWAPTHAGCALGVRRTVAALDAASIPIAARRAPLGSHEQDAEEPAAGHQPRQLQELLLAGAVGPADQRDRVHAGGGRRVLAEQLEPG